jgi:crossover junction endodeoxyribonuclease RuvC
MKVLAIDPGSKTLGFCLYEDTKCVVDGVIQPKRRRPSHLLAELTGALGIVADEFQPDVIACERMFTHTGTSGFHKTGGARNSAILQIIPDELAHWADERRVPFLLYAVATVKKAATGRGNAKKPEVTRAMLTKLTPASRKLARTVRENVADAHAVAWTAILHKYQPHV